MSWVLPRLVGVTRAADLLLSGRIVTAAETAEWGLWNDVLADGESPLAAAHAYAHLLATTVGPDAVTTTKRQLYRRPPPPRRGGIGRASRNDCSTTRCARRSTAKGIAALRDRRPPRFEAVESSLVAVGSAEGSGDTSPTSPVAGSRLARIRRVGGRRHRLRCRRPDPSRSLGGACRRHHARRAVRRARDRPTRGGRRRSGAAQQAHSECPCARQPRRRGGVDHDPIRRDLVDRRAPAGRGSGTRRHRGRHPGGSRGRGRDIVLRDT